MNNTIQQMSKERERKHVCIVSRGKIYFIPCIPFEPLDHAYLRAWFVVKKYENETTTDINKIINESKIYLNQKLGCQY
jgi:hypothetical protein